MGEAELEFAVPEESLPGLEAALRRGSVSVERMQAICFDTADERLGRHGVSLRLRKGGRHWVQTAKATTADSVRRLEHNVAVTVPHGRREPVIDVARHDGEPVGAALYRALSADAHGSASAQVAERFRTDLSRISRTFRVHGACVEMTLDNGKIIAGDRSTPVAEFELELKSGKVEVLMGLAAKWASRHRLWLSTVSKAERGARLVRGETGGLPVRASAPVVGAKPDAREFLVATLSSCLAQILGNASEIAAGAIDEEFVHQLRVGVRRLRTALRELKAGAEGADPSWAPVLRSAFQELGRHRDHAIVLPAIRVELDAAGVAPVPEPALAAGTRTPAGVVRAASFQRMLLGVLAFTHDPAALASDGQRRGKSVRPFVAKRLDALHRCLARDARRFDHLSDARQHRVRKRLKRLRYLSEFAVPLFPAADVARYLRRWQKA